MKLGYIRITHEDDPDVETQRRALEEAGCRRVWVEGPTQGRWDRPELNRLIDFLREEDTVVVRSLAALSRSMKDCVVFLDRIHKAEAFIISLDDQIDSSAPGGHMIRNLVSAFAHHERDLLRARTRKGRTRAKSEGRSSGRPAKLNKDQQREALRLILSGEQLAADVARTFNVHPSTISRLVQRHRASQDP